MFGRYLIAFGFAILLFSAKAFANDSSASLEAGGLVLKQQEDIAMVSEDLFISMDKIEVNYVFENRSGHNISTLVAFPMPDVPVDSDYDISIPFPDQDNFLNFKVFVEGTRVPVNIKKIRVKSDHCLNDEDSCEMDKTTFYWMQTFPAGKKLHVKHSYTPSVGSSVGSSPASFVEQFELNSAEAKAAEIKDNDQYCIEKSFLRVLANKEHKQGYKHVTDHWFGYILTTGANWAGGKIGDFRLVVDKGKPENMISFCAEGIKKISPTRFEVHKKNFTPTQDLHFLLFDDWRKF